MAVPAAHALEASPDAGDMTPAHLDRASSVPRQAAGVDATSQGHDLSAPSSWVALSSDVPSNAEVTRAEPIGEPDWFREAVAHTRGGFRRYLRELSFMLRRPSVFVREWATGQRRALNPLTFLSSSLAIESLTTLLFSRRIGLEVRSGWWEHLMQSALPYLGPISACLVAHPLMKLLKGRAKLRTALGASFFVSGSQGLLLSVGVLGLYVLLGIDFVRSENPWLQVYQRAPVLTAVCWVLILAGFAYFAASLCRSLAAVYRITAKRTALVLFLAYALVGFPLVRLSMSIMQADPYERLRSHLKHEPRVPKLP